MNRSAVVGALVLLGVVAMEARAGLFDWGTKDPVERYQKCLTSTRETLDGDPLEEYLEAMKEAKNRAQELSALRSYRSDIDSLKRKYLACVEEFTKATGKGPEERIADEEFDLEPEAKLERQLKRGKAAESGTPAPPPPTPKPEPATAASEPKKTTAQPSAPPAPVPAVVATSTSAPAKGTAEDLVVGAWRNIRKPYDELRVVKQDDLLVVETQGGLEKNPAEWKGGFLRIQRGDGETTAFYDKAAKSLVFRAARGQYRYERIGEGIPFSLDFPVPFDDAALWDKPAIFGKSLVVKIPEGATVTVQDIVWPRDRDMKPIWARASWTDPKDGKDYPGFILLSKLKGASERFVGDEWGFKWTP